MYLWKKFNQREMQQEEKIEVRCEFCNALYLFSPLEIFGDAASDTKGDMNRDR